MASARAFALALTCFEYFLNSGDITSFNWVATPAIYKRKAGGGACSPGGGGGS